MAQVAPTPITPIPTPVPQRSDPANFAARGDTLMTALPVMATEMNATATNVYNNAVDAFNSATNSAGSASTAFTQAQAAAQSAAAAAAAAGATQWISGTTYTIGDVVWSPLNFLSYRRKITGAGTTDPSLDMTNWALVGAPSSFPVTTISANTAAVASTHYIFTANLALTLPSAPSVGTAVQFTNLSGFDTCTINPGAEKIRNVSGIMTVNALNVGNILVYSGATYGWV